jgi:hypothetical protein
VNLCGLCRHCFLRIPQPVNREDGGLALGSKSGTSFFFGVSNPFRHARAREDQLQWRSRWAGPIGPQMNLTPMIDVLLVLIIIFMVVSQPLKQTRVDAQIPQPPKQDSPQPPPERTVVIQVGWGRTSIPRCTRSIRK